MAEASILILGATGAVGSALARRVAARGVRPVLVARDAAERTVALARVNAATQARTEAEAAAKGATGRAVTPVVLGALHRLSGGATLRANIALVRHNVAVAAEVAVAMGEP